MFAEVTLWLLGAMAGSPQPSSFAFEILMVWAEILCHRQRDLSATCHHHLTPLECFFLFFFFFQVSPLKGHKTTFGSFSFLQGGGKKIVLWDGFGGFEVLSVENPCLVIYP